ncbi:type IV pilin [Halalkaliarchaeum sp. AArc-GB]|uniref:type IV pilin n=1 Tax=unclassified Halalkaliarchaeum TaxID=2678344 RepID=UPI00217CD5DC|nr:MULTISPECIES: type IV pilin [unclassified Halalkaliarchaeum]MDR5672972.1 type IV pilin [Halalkaliarchaeum sp. AArc-GB]
MASRSQLGGANDAAAPVVGIVLLVALVVALATLVGFSVLGLGGIVDSSPSTTWSGAVVEPSPESGDVFLEFTHRGGDTVAADNLDAVILSGDGNASLGAVTSESDRLSAGDTVGIEIEGEPESELSRDTEIALVWEIEDRSAILAEMTLEEAVVIEE